MDFLLYWGTAGEIAFVILVFGGGSVAGLYIVRRLVPVDHLQKNHEVAGVTFGVLGTFYGLVLAFVIVAAWGRFNQANANAHVEATALESLYKLGAGFSEPMRTQLDSAVLEYTHHVVEQEWPQMADKSYHAKKGRALKPWSTVLSYHTADSREQMLVGKAIDQLNVIGQARNLRILFYEDDLPSVVWIVIYLGCAITISFSYFFGSNVFRAQAVMCALFSILLGITILAILELAHPYQGVVTIPDEPFRYALLRMEEVGNYKMAKITPGAENPQISQILRLVEIVTLWSPAASRTSERGFLLGKFLPWLWLD
jgi:Protein of unknown function (DUF4239)